MDSKREEKLRRRMKTSFNQIPTEDGKYFLRNDRIPAGTVLPYRNNAVRGDRLQKNQVSSYVVVGKIEAANAHRPTQTYGVSRRRLGAGGIFPGAYRIRVLEDCVLRCFHLADQYDRDDYEQVEVVLTPGESVALRAQDNVEAGAVIFGKLKTADGKDLIPGMLLDVRVRDYELTATTEATVVYSKRVTE